MLKHTTGQRTAELMALNDKAAVAFAIAFTVTVCIGFIVMLFASPMPMQGAGAAQTENVYAAEKAGAFDMYLAGMTEEQIAEGCGLSEDAIRQWRVSYGFREHVSQNDPAYLLDRIEARSWHLVNE